MLAAQLVTWRGDALPAATVRIRLLTFNDFHGELVTRTRLGDERPAGGAAVLAAYLERIRSRDDEHTLILTAGDLVGASPPVSGLLQDEPTMDFLNALADGDCPWLTRVWSTAAAPVRTKCRTLAVPGNHEFDEGTAEFERLLYGGQHPKGPFLDRRYRGTRIPFLAANIVRRSDGTPLLPASAVIELEGVKVGVIGAVTQNVPTLVSAGRVSDLQFLPEVTAINQEAERLTQLGVQTLVVVIHEGLVQTVGASQGLLSSGQVHGRLVDIVRQLDPAIDVVVSGHTHRYTNALLPSRGPNPVLVTQAYWGGTAYGNIELIVDRETGDVVSKAAGIETAFADSGPGAEPDKKIAKRVAAAQKFVAPRVKVVIGQAAVRIAREPNRSGESALGNLVADAERVAAGADIAFINAGGLRADLQAGPITRDALLSVQPFGNQVMVLTLTGDQIMRLLESQWPGSTTEVSRVLKSSGLRYTWDGRRPVGGRVIQAWDAKGAPITYDRTFRVAVNDFMLGGGDLFTVLREAHDAQPVMMDVEALELYVQGFKDPITMGVEGRIQRVD